MSANILPAYPPINIEHEDRQKLSKQVTLTRIIIVGLGQAGARFVRACMAINTAAPRVEIVAGVDIGGERCATFEANLAFPCYSTVDDAALSTSADVAIVTVPELNHFEILIALKRCFPNIRRILCEKPLAATAMEARELGQIFTDEEVSVNFVERFSPAVEELQRFMMQTGRRVVRANCFWGKYRVKDSRPTPGVISVELAHPIDLVLMLACVPANTSYEVVSVVASRSNFDVGDTGLLPLDTVHVALEFAQGLQVIASTSLLWSERQRRVELTIADESGTATELAVLVFDKPMWDLDRLEIYDICSVGGKPSLLQVMNVTAESWSPDRLTIGKVCRFLEANLGELDGQTDLLLPRLQQGIYVQDVLDRIAVAANAKPLLLSCYAQPEATGAIPLSAHVNFLSRVTKGESVEKSEFIWDHPY